MEKVKQYNPRSFNFTCLHVHVQVAENTFCSTIETIEGFLCGYGNNSIQIISISIQRGSRLAVYVKKGIVVLAL